MSVLRSKWTWIVALLVAGLAAIAAFSRTSVHAELLVPAKPDEVWRVLTDTAAYQDWNPVLFRVEGSFVEGSQVTLHLRQPDGPGLVITTSVRRVVDAQELNQVGGMTGVLTFDHRFLLRAVDGGTQLIQHEVYRGIGIWFWDSSWVEPAYA